MSADVDAAREALYQALLRGDEYHAAADFEAAIQPARAFEAAIRAERLDVERLGVALHEVYCHQNRHMHSAPDHSAQRIAAEYARLAEAAEPDYLTSREQRRLACVCGHPLVRHTEYGCIDCGTSERTTPQHNFTRRLAGAER